MKLGLADFEGYQPFQVAKKAKINKWFLTKNQIYQYSLYANYFLSLRKNVHNIYPIPVSTCWVYETYNFLFSFQDFRKRGTIRK